MPLAVLCLALVAADPAPDYARDVKPALQKHCVSCHNAKRKKGDLDLASFDAAAAAKSPGVAKNVLEQLHVDAMPPDGKPRLAPDEKKALENWFKTALAAADPRKRGPDAGPTPPRRLTREEFDLTLRDLLGVDRKLSEAFPADGGGGAGFDNNAATLYVPPILLEKYLDAARTAAAAADPARFSFARPGAAVSPRAAAERSLNQFLPRCYRRPIAAADVAPLLRVFDRAQAKGKNCEAALRDAVAAALVAPSFLFRIDRPAADDPTRVDDHALASRLSYFLWRSMPDDELFRLAAAGALHEPKALAAQAQRMLADPKSRAFTASFADQWLGLRTLYGPNRPDPGKYPAWNDRLRDGLVDEVRALCHEVFAGGGQLLDLVDADYSFLNERVAAHYGIPNVKGTELRRVKLPDRRRGGVATAGATLALHSYPLRTSPVLRGKFLLEDILGAPPPPPPPVTGVLSPDDKPQQGKTFRQRLEAHRGKAECAGCHARIDPLGFSLENFDPTGRWRDKLFDQPVDARGTLATGESFVGPVELKALLRRRGDAFAQYLAKKMLGFALGRGTEFYDEPFVAEIAAAARTAGRGDALALAVASSYPFAHRRPEGKGP